ncbi:hypothetical protein [Pedobacter steynii]
MGTKDSITVNKKLQPDTLWLGSDTLETQMVLQKTLKLIESPVLKKNNELGDPEKPQKNNGAASTRHDSRRNWYNKEAGKNGSKGKAKPEKKAIKMCFLLIQQHLRLQRIVC